MTPVLSARNRFIAERIYKVKPSGIRRFFGIAAKMPDVISLGIGEPDFTTPEPIFQAGFESVVRGVTNYTANSGLIELREKLSEHLENLYGVSYRAEGEIMITVGVSEALRCVFGAICNPGDEIIIPTPCFVAYEPEILFADGIPVTVTCKAENNFEITAEEIEPLITSKTKAIFLGFPNNPTGAVLGRENALKIAQLAEKYDFEFLFIDDGSIDRTYELLALEARQDHRIRVLRLSRNFGFQRSILANYMNARGAAAIQIVAWTVNLLCCC